MSGPFYTYTPNIPQASQYIRATQTPILNNFQAINEWIKVNHVGFEDSINYGKHNYISYVSQGSNPSTTSNQMTIFCAPSTGSNPYELFYRYPSDGTIVQLTGTTPTGGAVATGYAYISPTVFIMWGNRTGLTLNTFNTITFPTGPDFPTLSSAPMQIYFYPSANHTPGNNNGAYISASTTTNFTYFCNSGASTSIYWMIIAQ